MAVRDVTELAVYIKAYELATRNAEVGRMLGAMIKNADKYC